MRRLIPLLTIAGVLLGGLVWIWTTQPNVPTASVYEAGIVKVGSVPPPVPGPDA